MDSPDPEPLENPLSPWLTPKVRKLLESFAKNQRLAIPAIGVCKDCGQSYVENTLKTSAGRRMNRAMIANYFREPRVEVPLEEWQKHSGWGGLCYECLFKRRPSTGQVNFLD
jgi:hypothetical protein